MAVTSYWKTVNTQSFAGEVKIYEIETSGENKILNQIGGTITGDISNQLSIMFGSSHAFSNDGNIIAIGHENSSTWPSPSDPSIINHGKVRVFEYKQITLNEFNLANITDTNTSSQQIIINDGTPYDSSKKYWVQMGDDLGRYDLSDFAGDGFGKSVSLSDDGKILAVGSPGDTGARNSKGTGRVNIYRYVSDTWNEIGEIEGDFDIPQSVTSIGNYFGDSVKLSGDGTTLVVGAPQEIDAGPGYIRVFKYSQNEFGSDIWTKVYGVGASSAGQKFGQSISCNYDGSVIVVGSPKWSNDNKGAVYVYKSTGSSYTISGSITGTSESEFGSSVDINADGKIIAVGAPEVL